MTRVFVLGNPTARGGRQQVDAVAEIVRRRGDDVVVAEAESPVDASVEASEAVTGGLERVICIGGDGVAKIGVEAVAESDAVLGIVPYGTGNDFARALGLLGGSLDDQVERAMSSPVAIDAIRSDHGWVATVATIGFSGDVTDRANGLAWPRGQQRYTVATLLQLPRLRTVPLRVTVDGREIDGDTTLLAVGNTAYFGGGMRICPDARPDDGQLHLVSIGDVPRRTFLRVFPSVFSGRHVHHAAVTVLTGSTVTIAARDGNDSIWADGDVLGPLPVTLHAAPGALRVAGASIGESPGART